jgi:hypothetical protein
MIQEKHWGVYINVKETEGAIKNGEYRDTVNIEYTRRRKIKQKNKAICVGHH